VLVIWVAFPIYNLIMVSLEPHDIVFSSHIWPPHPSVNSYRMVVTQHYWYFRYFWEQFGHSIFLAAMTVILTLTIASLCSFSVGRLRIPLGWLVTNTALLTYIVPATYLAIPFYRLMDEYGMMNNLWAVIAALVAFQTPFGIFILQQYSRHIPRELDEAARIDGASPAQVFLRIYLPLMAPAMVAVGMFALLGAWNEFLYQYLLLSSPRSLTVPASFAQFFDSDEAMWNYMMAASVIYALPPVAIFYAFRRWMTWGRMMDGIKG
jgi:multiple sugar transport system permease protein